MKPVKPIVTIPNDVLTSPAKPVREFDARLAKLVAEMKETLLHTRDPKGVGLAAPQVGVGLRLFLTHQSDAAPVRVFVNPEIVSLDEAPKGKIKDDKLEGCLSIPGIWGTVVRGRKLTIKYQDEHGDAHEEEVSGFLAVICQHEVDHLNGILFTQRVLEQKNKFYQTAVDEEGKEILEEVTLV